MTEPVLPPTLTITPALAEAFNALFEAIEHVLASVRYPEHLNPSDPVCELHPNTLVCLEDACDQLMDLLIEEGPAAAKAFRLYATAHWRDTLPATQEEIEQQPALFETARGLAATVVELRAG